jgi:hypothetical protein
MIPGRRHPLAAVIRSAHGTRTGQDGPMLITTLAGDTSAGERT